MRVARLQARMFFSDQELASCEIVEDRGAVVGRQPMIASPSRPDRTRRPPPARIADCLEPNALQGVGRDPRQLRVRKGVVVLDADDFAWTPTCCSTSAMKRRLVSLR